MIKSIFQWRSLWQAAALYGCFLLSGCENDPSVLDAWTRKEIMVEEVTNVNTLFSQNGLLKANLKAPLMLRYQTDTVLIEFPKTLHVDFFDSTGKRESWLDARYGKYLESVNKVLLRDSVKVINIKGDTLTTSELWWDQNAKKFYTDSVVRIITKDKYIRGGRGLEASQDLDWTLIKRPTGTVLVGASPL
jgi:LPS export ABC transporter protein LptC